MNTEGRRQAVEIPDHDASERHVLPSACALFAAGAVTVLRNDQIVDVIEVDGRPHG